MDPALAQGTLPAAAGFYDGLGERRRFTDATGDAVEVLCLRRELTSIPSFEFALRERASHLAGFRHTYYGTVRSVDRLTDPASTLAVTSDYVRGVRLSQLLAQGQVTIDINAALHLIRQLVSAVAMMHENARDVAHGAIGPERVIITSNARVVIMEYVLGSALEQLQLTRQEYWTDLRVALPPGLGRPRFDHRTDVTQIGIVALSLILGRVLTDDEYPDGIEDVVSSAWAISARGALEPLPSGIRTWLARALQIDPRHSFESALDARAELDKVLSGEDESEYETVESSVQPAAAVPPPAPAPVVTAPAASAAPPVVHNVPAAPSVANAADVFELPAALETPQVRDSFDLGDGPGAPAAQNPKAFDAQKAPEQPAHNSLLVDSTTLDSFDEQPPQRSWKAIAAAAAVVLVLVGAGYGARRYFAAQAAAATGTLSISTTPAGADVSVDGQSRGATPLTLTLSPGPHTVEVKSAGGARTLPVTVVAGAQTSQYLELPAAAPTPATGQLQIRTEPAGAQVTVDAVSRGRAPVLVDGLAPGEHSVVVESGLGTVKQVVTVQAGMTASLVVPLNVAEGAPVSGWISISAPVELQVFESKRLVGTSQSDRIMVASGRHELEIINEPLGYRVVTTVNVVPGRVTPVRLEWPKGTVSINAQPWAEVWIDGTKQGETPIGNVPLPIGPHEIVFRHPELGELRHAISVTLKEPARVSVDLRKKQ